MENGENNIATLILKHYFTVNLYRIIRVIVITDGILYPGEFVMGTSTQRAGLVGRVGLYFYEASAFLFLLPIATSLAFLIGLTGFS